jgi:pyruvate dehydrogenase E1 component alpha subunit
MDVISFRFRGHSVIDPDRYRNQDEVKRGRAEHDPISQFATQLLDAGIIDDAYLKETLDQVNADVQKSIDFADQSPHPKIDDMYRYMYATEVPNVVSEAEKELFEARLREGKR